jgi:WD40 repeat protein
MFLFFLTIFLKKIWLCLRIRGAEAQAAATKQPLTAGGGLSFTIKELNELGDVKDLLGSFLEEQITQLPDPDTALVVLKAFVSAKGTKRQVTEDDVLDYSRTLGKNISTETLKELIQRFVNLRILRDKDESGRYELRHDALAAKIYEKITLVEKELIEIRQFIENAHENYKRRKVFLSASDLSYIAPYEDKMYLSGDLQQFLEESKRNIHKAKRRKRNLAIAAGLALLLVMTGFTWWAMRERGRALLNENKALAEKYNFLAKEIEETDPAMALRYAELAFSYDSTNNKISRTLLSLYYNYPTCKQIFTTNDFVSSVCFSPDGKTILIGSYDNTAKLYDRSGNLIKVYQGHLGRVYSVSFSSDGKQIITGSADGTVRLWSLDGQALNVYSEHEDQYTLATFSPDCKKIATASGIMVRLWDINGNLIKAFKGHNATITSIVFSPDGHYILTGSNDYLSCIWDLSGNRILEIKEQNLVSDAKFSPDGKTILIGCFDNSARLYDISGKLLQIFKGHDQAVLKVSFSPDGKRILSGSNDNKACLWDMSGNLLQVFKGHKWVVSSVNFAPDGKSIITGSIDKTVRLWDLSDCIPTIINGHKNIVTSINFSKDDKIILSGSLDSTIRFWDITGKCLKELKEFGTHVLSAAISPCGKTFLTTSSDGIVRLWDLSANLIHEYKGHTQSVQTVAFSYDGKYLLSGSADSTAILWNIKGDILNRLTGHNGMVTSVAFSPDGRNILTGSAEGSTRLWDFSGNLIRKIPDIQPVRSVSFSPDGKTILISSTDLIFKMYNLEGKALCVFKGHDQAVLSSCFSPDGKTILSGSSDNTARLWDLSGNELKVFKGHKNYVWKVAFSNDGKKIVTASMDSTIRIWDIKESYEIFKERNEYVDLSISDKLKYNVIGYDELINTGNKSELLEALDFYKEETKEISGTVSANTYISKILTICNKLNASEDPEVLLSILNSYQFLLQIDSGSVSIKKFEDVFSIIKRIAAIDKYQFAYIYIIQGSQSDDFKSKVSGLSKAVYLYEDIAKIDSSELIKKYMLYCYNELSNILLKNGDISKAITYAQKGFILDNTNLSIKTNIVLTYILDNRYNKVKYILHANKNKPFKYKEGTFGDEILNRITDLEAAGITHPDFAKVRELLNDTTKK